MDQLYWVLHGPGPWGGPWTPAHVLYTSPELCIDRHLESICQSHLFGQVDPHFENCDILRQHLLRNSRQTLENEKNPLTYLAFQRPQ